MGFREMRGGDGVSDVEIRRNEIIELLSTAENKSFGDASIDSNTEQNFAVIHRQSRKKNCIRLF